MGLLYGTLVALLVIMGVWWTYFLTGEANVQADLQLQKMATDRLHATFLIQADPRVTANPNDFLRPSFPHLIFTRTERGVDVQIDPAVVASIQANARTKRRMFLFEGLFFLLLLISGSTILIYAWRSEVKYKQSRELFLSGATHEFKTPLASLRLYTDTMCREGLGEADRNRIRGNMIQDMVRLENLVNDVLALSAGDAFDQGPKLRLDLAHEARQMIDDLARFAADRDSHFVIEADEGAFILGHRITLSLALRNLLVNAIKHSEGKVRVVVKVQAGRRQHHLVVGDNGPGIPRRLQKKVFECFYSGNREGRSGGAGIGLHLVRQNIENLGGRIDLVSEEGQGSTFTMTLPAAGKEGKP
jgi:signal transduction histidine kinase